MSREVIPVILKDAPRQDLLNSESFELFSLLEQTLSHAKVCFSCLLHPALSGRGCCQVRAAPPSTVLCACFPLALCFLAWIFFSWPLLGRSQLWYSLRGRYCLQQFILPVSCCYLWWHQSRDLFCLFSLHCFSRFLLWFLLIQTVKLLPNLSSSSWLPIINAALGVQVPFMPQICKISKLRKSLGRTLTAPVSIKD